MAISVNIRRWGNSNIIRLPKKLLSSLGDNYNSFSAEVKDGKLLLTPISKDKVNSLEELFEDFDVDKYFSEKQVDNLEMDWGKPQGLEKIE
ncbi:hypothetical protein FAX13_09325 [Ligilactobacillus animalis]|nr:hypothetical protein FAX13_09325 [Ligilactobacillus animalis]